MTTPCNLKLSQITYKILFIDLSPSFDEQSDHSAGGDDGDLLFPETDFDGFHKDDKSHVDFSSGPGKLKPYFL